MARRDDIRAMAKRLAADDAPETHLYVTDYRSLYVGRLFEIAEDDVSRDDREHVPAYYANLGLSCDFWFMLGDIRRLVTDDLPGVAEELRKLHNIHYHDKPVSLYGGMVDLPLIVTRPDGEVFFDEQDQAITGGRLWVEYDREVGGGVAAVQRDLRDNVLGEKAWKSLDWTSRTSVAAAERLYRDHRDDPAFDFAPVILGLAKATEVQCNAILRAVAATLPLPVRSVNIDGQSVDLARARSLSLGQLARAIGGDRELSQALAQKLENGAWFTASLPAVLDDLASVRNPAAHQGRVDRDTASRWRNQVLGVGAKGHLVELAAVRPKRP